MLTVDGARLNYNTAHGGNLNFVDIESLERLEIIRGPASALYGSSALGGTINILTKSGSEMLRPGQTVGARVRWTFNSANRELSEHVSLYGIIGKRFDYIASYTRRDASDVETARDTIDNSGFHTNDVFLKSRYFLTERDTLSFTTQLFSRHLGYSLLRRATNTPAAPKTMIRIALCSTCATTTIRQIHG